MERLINTNRKDLDLTWTYSQKENSMKPRGLWYSINYEWLEWCRGNYSIHSEMISLNIDLSKILIIENSTQLDSLMDIFGYYIVKGVKYINWEKLSTYYSGIEFRNYNQTRNCFDLHNLPTWFYTLDCSCGCIWDLSVIKNYKHSELDLSLWVDNSEH